MEIIVSHNNTDFDGLASMIAAKKIHPEAELVYAGKLQRNVGEFMSLHKDTFKVMLARDIPMDTVTRLILVDNKNPARIGEAKQVLSNKDLEIYIYDHHPRYEDDIKGDVELIEEIGSATTLLVELIKEKNLEVTPFESTVFAMGIYEDTGNLTYANTSYRDAAAVAFLLERGANLSLVTEFTDRPLSEIQRKLLNSLIIASETINVNGFSVLVTSAGINEYIDGLGLIVHKIIDLVNADVAIAAVYMEDRIHIVARSKEEAVNVAKLLAPFKGGGHPRAASATVKTDDLDGVVHSLKDMIIKNIEPEISVESIMSAPVKMIPQDKNIDEAARILMRYGHTGLPVVDGEKLVGIISRRDIDKAKHHGLGHAPVKGFMSRKVITAHKQQTLQEIQKMMIENNIGRLPVLEDGKIIGIVSRTDVLRSLHGENYPGRYEKVYHMAQPMSCVGDHVVDLMKNLPSKIRELLAQISFLSDREGFQVYVVGGFVRDLILDVHNLDIDLVVEGDGPKFAGLMAEFLCGRVKVHEKFGTAMVILEDDFRIDVATARTEYYEFPAALPRIEESSLKQDLYRRDFTINAMAVHLSEKNFGEIVDFFGGRKDLNDGVVRVLYNLSFVEDPTRILRAIRFEQRYGFRIEQQTLTLLKNAVREKLLSRLSADRIRQELKHIFEERAPLGAILRMDELGVLIQILPQATLSPAKIEAVKRIQGAADYIHYNGEQIQHRWIIYLALLLADQQCNAAVGAGEMLRLSRDELKVLTEIKCNCDDIITKLSASRPMKLSEVAVLLNGLPKEGYVYIMALNDHHVVHERLKNYMARSKYSKLSINGKDLKEMGYKPGPDFHSALSAARAAKLDGDINTRDEELDFVRLYMKELNH